jgi:hypothetical protein
VGWDADLLLFDADLLLFDTDLLVHALAAAHHVNDSGSIYDIADHG